MQIRRLMRLAFGQPLARLALLALIATPILSCGGSGSEVSEADRERARAALVPFKKQLFQALSTAMAEGGPESAIEVCRIEAPGLAARASSGGIEVGRTSHRLRNPENAPESWTEALLAEYVASPADTTSRALTFTDGRIGYVEPIHVKPLCLTCHGDAVAEPVRDRLTELYPDDRAVGFREGDFRGLFWVRLPAERTS